MAVPAEHPVHAGFARQHRGPFWLVGLLGAALALVWVARALALGLPALAAEPVLPASPPSPTPTPAPAKGSLAPGMDGSRGSGPDCVNRVADPVTDSAPDHKQDLIRMLGAPGPHASLKDQAGCFDRFVGTWDCDYALFGPDSKVTRFSGQAVFGWVLDGWAMQDVWWSRSGPGHSQGLGRNIGTTLRFFDRKAGLWRVTWIAPGAGAVIQLEGGSVAGDRSRIVLNGKDTDGSLTRWSFHDIAADAFVWRSENSRNGGKDWVMREEHHLKRHREPASRTFRPIPDN